MTVNKRYNSPGIARGFLRLLSVYHERHSIFEDFEETFSEIQESEGRLKAKSWYWRNTLGRWIFKTRCVLEVHDV